MKSKEPPFLVSPDWQPLLLTGSKRPFFASQPENLRLRSQFHVILLPLPGLFIDCSMKDDRRANMLRGDERLKALMSKASAIFGDVQEWLTGELEPLILSHKPSQHLLRKDVDYPDIIYGVLDCVANTALLTVDKLFRSLAHARQNLGNESRWSELEQLGNEQLFHSPEDIEQRRWRATTAFNFVRRESTLAAKPLEFGLQQSNLIF